jgi:ribosomal subunit interface protein
MSIGGLAVDVAVSGRKNEVSTEVRELAQAKVSRVISHAPVLERAEIKLGEDPHAPAAANRVCEVIATGHGHTLRARAGAPDFVAAVDIVVDKLEHQVERLKGKLLGRSHARRAKDANRA